MTLAGRIRAHLYRAEIENRERFYQAEHSKEQIAVWQLKQFNSLWVDIQQYVPYYRKKVRTRTLPQTFQSWEQFQHEMPVLSKDALKENMQEMQDERRKPDFYSKTSGSTAEPLKLYHWKSEEQHRRIDMWLGRHWHGITPADRSFFLWGDRHRQRKESLISIARSRRRIKDWLLGYFHFPSNDISSKKMHEAADLLIRHRPDYLVGYSTSLEIFALENIERQSEFAKLKLKGVIATAASFSDEESSQMISRVLHAPVIMEYGSEENGVIAYTDKSGAYRVFWQNTMLEGWDTDLPLRKNLLITSLYPRCVPIIRYEQGDELELCSSENKPYSLTRFKHLHGRAGDYIELEDGSRIMPVSFHSIIKQISQIRAYQIVVMGARIELHLVLAEEKLPESDLHRIHKHLSRVHQDLEKIKIKIVQDVYHTPRGKTPRIYRLEQQRKPDEIT